MKFFEAENYQPQVKKRFEEIKQALKTGFPDAHIEHIGSSAIEDLISKGDLDIYLGTPPEKHGETVNRLEEMGYVVKQEIREQYNQLKRDSASLDEDTYRSKKAIFIQHILEECD